MTDFAAPISEQIWDMKYRLKRHNGEIVDKTVQDTWRRIAKALSEREPQREQEFYNALDGFKFLPAGRITAGAGTGRNVTLFNCYVMGTIPDSLSGIFDMLKEAAMTMQQGGGIGYDFSTIRPKGAAVKGVDADASGPLSFMDVWDAMCRTIMSAGSRRGAMMATMRCDHPDIEEFISAKQEAGRLRNFNVSVLVTDAFMDAVKSGGDFDLKFGGKVYRTVKALDLWNKIMHATYAYAEPGVLFIDRINKANNLWYAESIASTNPCVTGETPILTIYGWKRIESVVGKSIDVWNGEEWSRVFVRATGENQRLVTVTLSDGSIIDCTPSHRFVMHDGSRKDASALSSGDKLLKHEWPVIEGLGGFANAYAQGFFSGDGWQSNGRQYIGLYGDKIKLKDHLTGYMSDHDYAIGGGFDGTDTSNEKTYLYYGRSFFAQKSFVPDAGFYISSRLNWLAGLIDSDGCAVRDKNSVAVQVSSKDRDFLMNVKLMLNTLGATGVVSEMKDHWRLSISATNVKRLQGIGLETFRVDISNNNPQRDAGRFVSVVSVDDRGEVADYVYCFTEYGRHMGCFGGVLTGNCGEQPLPPYGACLLGSINLARVLDSDIESLTETAVRMMDATIDVSRFPLDAQAQEARNKRRIGLGVTGVADWLALAGVTYGSEEAQDMLDRMLRRITRAAYLASVDMAKEKGAFPLFDADKYLQGEFIQSLDQDVQDAIRRHGIRNSHLTSIAPTGTISLYAGNVSSGIEPIFALEYDRKVTLDDGSKATETVTDYAVQMWRDSITAPLPEWFVTAQTLSPDAHVKMQAVAQRHVDSAISKTINCPADISFDAFKDVYMMAYDLGCKGCTTYRPNDVTGSVLEVTQPDGGACVYDPETGERSCSG